MFFYLFFTIKNLFHFFISLFQKQKVYKVKQSKQNDSFIPYKTITSSTKKPLWVKNEIIYLKALLPNYGCRKIANIFNKQYHHKNISISKSYVYYIIKENKYKIIQKRKNIKNKKTQVLPKNFLWQIDLTNISDYFKSYYLLFRKIW